MSDDDDFVHPNWCDCIDCVSKALGLDPESDDENDEDDLSTIPVAMRNMDYIMNEMSPEERKYEAMRVATNWHGGQWSATYALSSAGALLPSLLDEIDNDIDEMVDENEELPYLRRLVVALTGKTGRPDDRVVWWVCSCCYATSVNGKCCDEPHPDDQPEVLSIVPSGTELQPWVYDISDPMQRASWERWGSGHQVFSWDRCDGCNGLPGERYRLTSEVQEDDE